MAYKATWIFLSIIIVFCVMVDSKRCIQCSQSYFHGEPGLDDCYTLENKNDTTCNAENEDDYCFTKLELSDGMLSYLKRGCSNPTDDPVKASNEFPDSMKCSTSYSKSKRTKNIQQTECFIPCKGDLCNDLNVLDNVKSCPHACPANSECNYLTGKCQCAQNRDGVDCNNIAPIAHESRTCVQCNSKTEQDCAEQSAATKCQNGETLCSTSQTWILGPDGSTATLPVVVRSCTAQSMTPDRCYLSNTNNIGAAKYTEYTCVSTCPTDGCNTGNANGIVDKEFIPMRCVVCEGDERNCGPNRNFLTDCPRNTTHCSTTVTYWATNVKDSKLTGRLKPESSISIRAIKRQCATESIPANCTTRLVGTLSLEEVTCQDSCTGDGCNTGWPSRPKCVQCDKDGDNSSNNDCLNYPPTASFCPGPHQRFCFAHFLNRTRFSSITLPNHKNYSVSRGCSTYYDKPDNECRTIAEYGETVGTECVAYCSRDGCNFKTNDFRIAQGFGEITKPENSSKSLSSASSEPEKSSKPGNNNSITIKPLITLYVTLITVLFQIYMTS